MMNPFRKIFSRMLLSRAKHMSLQGHPKMAQRLSSWISLYSYGENCLFSSDSAPLDIQEKRRQGFKRLADHFRRHFKITVAWTEQIEGAVSDLAFVNSHRVPFQYQ